jgi:EcsC protein family
MVIRDTPMPYSHYERSALGDVIAWQTPYRTPFSSAVHAFKSTRMGAGGDGANERPPREEHALVGRGLGHAVHLLGRAAAYTMTKSPVAAFKRAGHLRMRGRTDIAKLDLWEVDEVAAGLQVKYVVAGALAGLVAASRGTQVWLATSPLLGFLALRVVHEYAARYGFDVTAPEEQAFAERVFVSALSPKPGAAIAEMDRQTADRQTADRQTADRQTAAATESTLHDVAEAVLGGLSVLGGALKLVRKLGRRFLASKVARAVPVVRVVAAAGINAWFLHGVAHTAELAYRERFVARRHAGEPVPLLEG